MQSWANSIWLKTLNRRAHTSATIASGQLSEFIVHQGLRGIRPLPIDHTVTLETPQHRECRVFCMIVLSIEGRRLLVSVRDDQTGSPLRRMILLSLIQSKIFPTCWHSSVRQLQQLTNQSTCVTCIVFGAAGPLHRTTAIFRISLAQEREVA
jgi:hypothetical protein